MRFLRGFVLFVLLVFAGVLAWQYAQRPGAVLYRGGPILTLDATNRVVDALASDGERILAVGDVDALSAWADKRGARIVELGGRALLPGFIDAHGHFPGAGIYAVHVDLNSPPIHDVQTIDDLVARLSARAAETPEGEWVVGMSYDDTLLAERRHPTRRDLDRVSTKHPVGVLHISGHLAVVNGVGLEALGFDASSPDPEGGVIRRFPGGDQPDGVLEETAMEGFAPRIVPGALDGLKVLRRASQLYLQAGVTTAQSGLTPAAMMRVLAIASRLGLVPLRLVLWPDLEASESRLAGQTVDAGDPSWARVGATKLVADGSIQGYTGYLREPYHVPPGDDPGYRGYPRIPRDALHEQVKRLHQAGLQVAVHGNGDASIDDILDAYEAAQKAHPRQDARHVIIHAQMARDDQLDRMAALGVIPSFFSLHTFYWGDRHRTIFMGPERAARMSPAASALARGVRFTIHADTPVVPMEPLRLVWAAVNRRTRSDFELGRAQRIGVTEALRAVTIDAAYQHFEEEEKGSLEVGKLADLVILSRSPLEDPAGIRDIQVLETIVGGRSAWRAGD